MATYQGSPYYCRKLTEIFRDGDFFELDVKCGCVRHKCDCVIDGDTESSIRQLFIERISNLLRFSQDITEELYISRMYKDNVISSFLINKFMDISLCNCIRDGVSIGRGLDNIEERKIEEYKNGMIEAHFEFIVNFVAEGIIAEFVKNNEWVWKRMDEILVLSELPRGLVVRIFVGKRYSFASCGISGEKLEAIDLFVELSERFKSFRYEAAERIYMMSHCGYCTDSDDEEYDDDEKYGAGKQLLSYIASKRSKKIAILLSRKLKDVFIGDLLEIVYSYA